MLDHLKRVQHVLAKSHSNWKRCHDSIIRYHLEAFDLMPSNMQTCHYCTGQIAGHDQFALNIIINVTLGFLGAHTRCYAHGMALNDVGRLMPVL